MIMLRRFSAALLAVAALVLSGEAAPANAQTGTCRPWCRERSGGGTNCGFISFEQCMWTAYGADMCMPNAACPPQNVHEGDSSARGKRRAR
jgi:hypothetical protein